MADKPECSTTHANIIIVFLCTVIIILGIAYNSLRNENIALGEALTHIENECYSDQEDITLLPFRITALEEEVFRNKKRK